MCDPRNRRVLITQPGKRTAQEFLEYLLKAKFENLWASRVLHIAGLNNHFIGKADATFRNPDVD
jgi:hypothetical protein